MRNVIISTTTLLLSIASFVFYHTHNDPIVLIALTTILAVVFLVFGLDRNSFLNLDVIDPESIDNDKERRRSVTSKRVWDITIILNISFLFFILIQKYHENIILAAKFLAQYWYILIGGIIIIRIIYIVWQCFHIVFGDCSIEYLKECLKIPHYKKGVAIRLTRSKDFEQLKKLMPQIANPDSHLYMNFHHIMLEHVKKRCFTEKDENEITDILETYFQLCVNDPIEDNYRRMSEFMACLSNSIGVNAKKIYLLLYRNLLKDQKELLDAVCKFSQSSEKFRDLSDKIETARESYLNEVQFQAIQHADVLAYFDNKDEQILIKIAKTINHQLFVTAKSDIKQTFAFDKNKIENLFADIREVYFSSKTKDRQRKFLAHIIAKLYTDVEQNLEKNDGVVSYIKRLNACVIKYFGQEKKFLLLCQKEFCQNPFGSDSFKKKFQTPCVLATKIESISLEEQILDLIKTEVEDWRPKIIEIILQQGKS